MPVETDLDELRLAWARWKFDRPKRVFVFHPHIAHWIDLDPNPWLADIQSQLMNQYEPEPGMPCSVPKAGSMLRPVQILSPKDEVVYNVLVAKCIREIWGVLEWSQGDPDIAFQLREPNSREWISSGFRIWSQWREKSIEKLAEPIQYVVVSDITGYYENIDLPKLRDDLRNINAPSASVDMLLRCLNRWADPRGKGIPQGYSASDILAKLYFNSIDRALQRIGFNHLRYVDDLRIFCRTRLEARRAILFLSGLLSRKGLNLQSAKTRIHTVQEARLLIDGVTPTIMGVQAAIREEAMDDSLYGTALGGVFPAPETETFDPQSRIVIERTFRENFSEAVEQSFDKTLFHYLLTRLGRMRSRIAVQYCLSLIISRPEETWYLLNYFTHISLETDELQEIVDYLESESAIYDYQLFEIIAWFLQQQNDNDVVFRACRRFGFDQNRPIWLRSVCLAYLGRQADQVDFDAIEELYPRLGTELEKADCIVALKHQEIGRRNAFYGRSRADGELVNRAIQTVQQQT